MKKLEKALSAAQAAEAEATAAITALKGKLQVAEAASATAEAKRRDVALNTALEDPGATAALREATIDLDTARSLVEGVRLALEQASANLVLRRADVAAAADTIRMAKFEQARAERIKAAENLDLAWAGVVEAVEAFQASGRAIYADYRDLLPTAQGEFMTSTLRIAQSVPTGLARMLGIVGVHFSLPNGIADVERRMLALQPKPPAPPPVPTTEPTSTADVSSFRVGDRSAGASAA